MKLLFEVVCGLDEEKVWIYEWNEKKYAESMSIEITAVNWLEQVLILEYI